MDILAANIDRRLAARILVYVLGLFVLAFGAVFAINSNLGISPVNSLPFVVSLITGTDPGFTIAIAFLIFIALQFVLLRKDLPLINLTQIIFALLFGYFVDAARFIVGSFTIPTYAGQLAMMACSIIFIAFGLSLYMEARLVNMPPEGLVIAITRKIPGGVFHRVKIVFDCVLVSMSVVLSLIFLGGFDGVREGTIISALMIGRAIPPARKVVAYILNKLNFYPPEPT